MKATVQFMFLIVFHITVFGGPAGCLPQDFNEPAPVWMVVMIAASTGAAVLGAIGLDSRGNNEQR